MPGRVKDVNHGVPNDLPSVFFVHRHRLSERSPAAVLGLDGGFKLVG